MFMTCEVAMCRVVGSADPHPNMFTSNFFHINKDRYINGEPKIWVERFLNKMREYD